MHNELDILVVEDDMDERMNMVDILELDGHRVMAVGTAEEACELARSQKVGVIILDRNLPDGTADEVLPRLKSLLPSSHVVVVTGYADLDSTIAAFRHGAADYILKPINPDALRHSLERIAQVARVEYELSQEQQFADQILSTAEAVVLVLDLQGKIIRFNPYYERIADWSLDELQGKDWFDACIPVRDHDRIREVFLLTADGLERSGIINPIITRSGQERQIRWSNTTLKDKLGVTIAVLAVGVDVTDFLEAQERASRSERLAAIGQTMAALAHESRNALQRIHAGLDLLQLELPGESEAQGDLDTVRRAATDLNSLLEEVRSYAAPIRLHLEPCDVRQLAMRAWRHLESAWSQRQVELHIDETFEDVVCRADPTRIEQVYRNLFENALAACSDPVQISVCCERLPHDLIQISVTDNGPGLNDEQCEKIFEPFFTTKSTGTGLGMSIVHRIIDAHQGCISLAGSATNEDHAGACFIIRLPLDPQCDEADSV
ncbi:ATP-binding protein [Stieleria varia]|uniref:histidine kinase n=1 Tax=Stieleria varia TaxID=2528005 RepID=A0A5C6AT42_9BACT|nr:ATP-binding protein [Stieleria varia]TWU02459.1 Sensor protein ZraS [Stieleria varia]